MSKAFTRESDDSEEQPPVRAALPPGTRNYITRHGADRLKQQLAEALASKQTAPASEQQKIEPAIRRLQHVLDSVIVADLPADREKVAFGATVVIRRGNGEEETYRIVGVEEAEPESGSISWLSPLARALLSRRTGDKVKFRAPAGADELTVVSISYEER
jgi:transcription elongation factor GreB